MKNTSRESERLLILFLGSPIIIPGTAHVSNGNVDVTWTYVNGITSLYSSLFLSSEYNVRRYLYFELSISLDKASFVLCHMVVI